MITMKLKNFAIDFGNGYVKAISDDGSFITPAKLAFEHNLGRSSLGNTFEESYNINAFHHKEDQAKTIFGKDIESAISPSKLISTNSNNNRYLLQSFRQLVDFSLAELASLSTDQETSIDVRLVTGMPSGDMQKGEFLEAFKSFLEGHHVVYRNEQEYVINVKELKIIEQPLGTLLNVFLNDKLKIHKNLKNGLVVVIDFGSGTTIIDVYQNMKLIGGKTLPEGMIKFHELIANSLSKTSNDVDSLYVEKGIINKSYIAEFGQQKISFKKDFDIVLKEKIQTIIQAYENEIGKEELVNDFIVTGGGSLIIGDQLKEQKPKFQLVDNPQLSTAAGYYKLAQAMRKDD